MLLQVSTPNDYSVSVGSSQGLRIELRNDRSEPSHVSDAHHYEKENLVERELLVGTEHDYEYEDEYWEPAMQETQLKQQLTCLNVKETSIDDLE